MIYILHFAQPYKHARHYVGYASKNVERRVREHLEGTGRRPSPLVKVVRQAGIEVLHVATLEGGRGDERRIKDNANTASDSSIPSCQTGLTR